MIRGRRLVAAATVMAGMMMTVAATPDVGSTVSTASRPRGSGDFDTDATVRVALAGAPSSWDPAVAGTSSTVLTYLQLVYDGLALLTPEGAAPMLATSWEESDDHLSWTLRLREDVMFQSGAPFNAEAVKANIERYQTLEGSLQAAAWENVTAVTVVDDSTVTLELAEADSLLPYVLSSVAGLMVDPSAFDQDLAQTPAGSGPFALEASRDDGASLTRVDHPWPFGDVAVSRAELTAVSDNNARLNGFTTGQFDVIFPVRDDMLDQADPLVNEGATLIMSPPSVASRYELSLNTNNPELAKPEVRQAIFFAIDRAAFIEAVAGGHGEVNVQPLPSDLPGYVPELDELPSYDLDKARELMQAAGVEQLTLRTIVPQILLAHAQALQGELAKIGVTLELVPFDNAGARTEYRAGGYDAHFSSFVMPLPDPASLIESNYLGGDNLGPVDEELAAMNAEASTLPVGSEERAEAFAEISRYVYEHPLHIPVMGTNTGTLLAEGWEVLAAGRQQDPRFLGMAAD